MAYSRAGAMSISLRMPSWTQVYTDFWKLGYFAVQTAKAIQLANEGHLGLIVEDYNSSRVGVVCHLSPNLNMGLSPNALS